MDEKGWFKFDTKESRVEGRDVQRRWTSRAVSIGSLVHHGSQPEIPFAVMVDKAIIPKPFGVARAKEILYP